MDFIKLFHGTNTGKYVKKQELESYRWKISCE